MQQLSMRRHRISLSCLKRITILSLLELFDNYFETNLCQTLLTVTCLLNIRSYFKLQPRLMRIKY